MKFSELLIASFLVAFFLFSTLGARLNISPISINIIVGHSMYPTLKQGDLAIGISASIDKYSKGDIVIYCRSFNYCIIHRVISFENGTLITKGDNNPIPDPPVSPESVRYRVIFTIPAWLWIPSLFLISSLSYIDIRRPRESLFSAFNLEAFLYTLILLSFVTLFVIIIIQEPGKATSIPTPEITLKSIYFSENKSSVFLIYNLQNITLLSLQSCSVGTSNFTLPCEGSIYSNDSLSVAIPEELLLRLYESDETYFQINLTITLDKGVLLGRYPLIISWQKPELILEDSNLIIENKNPVPLRVLNATIYYMSSTAYFGSPLLMESISLLNETIIPPMGVLKEDFPVKYDYAYIKIFYEYMNQTVMWVGKVQFS